jgi:hypothetical protein
MSANPRVARALCRISALLVFGLCSTRPAILYAQAPAGAGTSHTTLPDSPQPKPQGTTGQAAGTTTRFVGYMTNKSFVFPDIAHSEGPMTTGEKFRLFVNQSVSPPYLIAAAINAAYSQARNVPEAYGQGWSAYGGRFGAALGRTSSNAFFSTFVLASAFHQDPRFYPQYRPTLWGSVKYSAKRLFVTHTDSSRDTFNSSQIFGTLMAESLANVYLPVSEQNAGKTFERFGTDLAWRFAGNMFKNYWPTVFHGMGLNRLKVIPDPGSPDNQGTPHLGVGAIPSPDASALLSIL